MAAQSMVSIVSLESFSCLHHLIMISRRSRSDKLLLQPLVFCSVLQTCLLGPSPCAVFFLSDMIHPKNESILIVGAGCFGVSTAYHLLQRGYTNVTVVDRAETLPAPDGASNDLNRSQ